MNVVAINPLDRLQRKQFLDLPFRLYARLPQWVPPLAMDAAHMLDSRRHPFYRHSQAAFFLAYEGGQAVGRLAVLDNHNYNAFNHSRTAFFYLFECEDHPAAALALFAAGEQWARGRGLTDITGPKGFSALDGLGLLVQGFEHRPAFGLPYNPPYYPALVEAAGFQPCGEMVSGYLNKDLKFPPKLLELAEVIKRRRGLYVQVFKTRSDLRRLIPRLKELYNNSLEGTHGNVPLTDEEVKTLADQMLWFANPRLIKIVMKRNPAGYEPVGYLFAYPDISAAVQRTRGRLWPFGWLDLLLELRRTDWININGAGMLPEYRGLGGTALLFSEMYKSVSESGYTHADLVQVGTENERMLRELRDLGIDFYKLHRLYRKEME